MHQTTRIWIRCRNQIWINIKIVSFICRLAYHFSPKKYCEAQRTLRYPYHFFLSNSLCGVTVKPLLFTFVESSNLFLQPSKNAVIKCIKVFDMLSFILKCSLQKNFLKISYFLDISKVWDAQTNDQRTVNCNQKLKTIF